MHPVGPGPEFDEGSIRFVISSPLKRALQTAALVGTETGYEKKIQLSQAMAPEGTWSDFQRLLESVVGTGRGAAGRTQSQSAGVFESPAISVGDQPHRACSQRRDRGPDHAARVSPVAMAAGSPPAAGDSIQRHQEIAGKNLAEIVGLFAQRPQFQVRSFSSRHQQDGNFLGSDAGAKARHCSGLVLMQGDRHAQQHRRLLHTHMLFHRNVAQHPVARG